MGVRCVPPPGNHVLHFFPAGELLGIMCVPPPEIMCCSLAPPGNCLGLCVCRRRKIKYNCAIYLPHRPSWFKIPDMSTVYQAAAELLDFQQTYLQTGLPVNPLLRAKVLRGRVEDVASSTPAFSAMPAHVKLVQAWLSAKSQDLCDEALQQAYRLDPAGHPVNPAAELDVDPGDSHHLRYCKLQVAGQALMRRAIDAKATAELEMMEAGDMLQKALVGTTRACCFSPPGFI